MQQWLPFKNVCKCRKDRNALGSQIKNVFANILHCCHRMTCAKLENKY